MRAARSVVLVFALASASPLAAAGLGACARFAAGGVDDAGTADAAPAPFDAASRGCSGVDATFCDDFDDAAVSATARPFGWTGSDVWDAGNVMLVDASFVSPPRAFHADFVGPASGSASIERTFKQAYGIATLDFDVFLGSRADAKGERARLASIQLLNETVLEAVLFEVQTSTTTPRLVEKFQSGPMNDEPGMDCGSGALKMSSWMHVTLTLDATHGPATASLGIDGVGSCTLPLVHYDAITKPYDTSIRVGVVYTDDSSSGRWAVDLDDVVLRAQ